MKRIDSFLLNQMAARAEGIAGSLRYADSAAGPENHKAFLRQAEAAATQLLQNISDAVERLDHKPIKREPIQRLQNPINWMKGGHAR